MIENTDKAKTIATETTGSLAPEVSVIIVSYWTGPLLIRSVISALQQPEVLEVIVVNNGNPSVHIKRLKALSQDAGDRLMVQSGHGNIGFAAACNQGARTARGKFIFLLNPDAILPAGSIGQLLKAADQQTGLWVIGGKLINPDGSEQAGSRRGPLTPWSAFVEMTQIWRLAPNHPYFRRFNQHQTACPTETIPISVISGACMLMPRQTFDAIEGMDERYFLHVEDIDFCLRLQKAGGTILFTPDAEIIHYKSSSRANAMRVEFRKARSMVTYFWTHFRDPYPLLFLWLVSALVWVGFGFRFIKRAISRSLALIGLRHRRGNDATKRAKAQARKRSRR